MKKSQFLASLPGLPRADPRITTFVDRGVSFRPENEAGTNCGRTWGGFSSEAGGNDNFDEMDAAQVREDGRELPRSSRRRDVVNALGRVALD